MILCPTWITDLWLRKGFVCTSHILNFVAVKSIQRACVLSPLSNDLIELRQSSGLEMMAVINERRRRELHFVLNSLHRWWHCWSPSWPAVSCRTRRGTCQLQCSCWSYCSPVKHHWASSYQGLKNVLRFPLEHCRPISMTDKTKKKKEHRKWSRQWGNVVVKWGIQA